MPALATTRRTLRLTKRPSWLAIATAAALAVGLVLGIQAGIPRPVAAKPDLALGLNVTNTGGGLRLSWNHQASRRANSAVLWIRDGNAEYRVDLDSRQLGEGSVAYWPTSGDVNFRLELVAPGQRVTESVRAIGGPSNALTAVEDAVDSPPLPDERGTAVTEVEAPAAKDAPRPRRHAFAVPQAKGNIAPAVPAALPDPPAVQAAPALPPEQHRELLKSISPANGDGATSSLRVSVEPVSGSRLTRVARNIPLIGKRYRRSDYVPPAPLRTPVVAAPPHGTAQDVNVDVKVRVNVSGKVEYSEVLSKVAEKHHDLSEFAMSAAQQWEFVPARSGSVAVPGDVILHYRFGGGPPAAGR